MAHDRNPDGFAKPSCPAASSTWDRLLIVAGTTLILFASCRDRSTGDSVQTPAPPDLSQCTRIEVRIEPSVSDALLRPYPDVRGVLSEDELRHIESLETLVIDDPQYIQTLAQDIASVPFSRPREGSIAVMPVYHVSGWRDQQCLATFTVKGPVLLTEEHVFRNKRHVSLTPQLTPFERRLECAENLRWLATKPLTKYAESHHAYPAPSQWCGVVVQLRVANAERLACPGAGEGACHYAMNPNCEPNSAGDMVLLFETKAGWNQQGGPELFTFENHDPRGGCVLLRDGTVKFIRTDEALHTLHWK